MKKSLFVIVIVIGFLQSKSVFSQSIELPVNWISQFYANCNTSQSNHLCGPTCTEMAIAYFNDKSPSNYEAVSYLPGTIISQTDCGRSGGYSSSEMAQIAKAKGAIESYITNNSSANIDFLYNNLKQGNLIAINVNYSAKLSPNLQSWSPPNDGLTRIKHWVLVVGINKDSKTVIINDPGRSAVGDGSHKSYSFDVVNSSWNPTRACVVFINSNLNQNLDIYGGSVLSPKPFGLYFNKSAITGSFDINNISNIKIGDKPISNNRISASKLVSVKNPDGTTKSWCHFTLALKASDLSGLTDRYEKYTVSFDYTNGGQAKAFKSNNLYFTDFYDQNRTFTDLNDPEKKVSFWAETYIRSGASQGLFRGSSLEKFNPTSNLTRGQVAIALISTAAKLGLCNIDISTKNGMFADEGCKPGTQLFPFVQTMRNYGFAAANANFYPNNSITVGEFCAFIKRIFNLQSSDYAPTAYINGMYRKISPEHSNTDIKAAMNAVLRLVYTKEDSPGFWRTENIWDFADASKINTPIKDPIKVDGTELVSRAVMAKVVTNVYLWKLQKLVAGSILKSAEFNNQEPVLDDMVAIGEKYDNTTIPSGVAPIAKQSVFNCEPGGSITIFYPSEYDASGNPYHFYWSMQKNGATLISMSDVHKSVKFSAPNVSEPTTWKLYSYLANNKGKSSESFITINVEPKNSSISPPDEIQLISYSSNSFKITWENNGNDIARTVIEYSQDPSFGSNVVSRTVNSSVLYLIATGISEGTYYVRGKSVTSGGVSSNWSEAVSKDIRFQSEPYIPTLIPVRDSLLTSNSVTLKFQAENGNAPLNYTVYFSTWHPLDSEPIATNTTLTTLTLNNLAYNQDYYWVVKVRDADGDEYMSSTSRFTTARNSTPPSGFISIENGAETTNSLSVNINVNVTTPNGRIVSARYSNDGINWPEYWEAFNTTRSAWNLAENGGTSTPGLKTVYAQFKDNSDNIITLSDNINLVPGTRGQFIVRNKRFSSLKVASDYSVAGDTIFVTAGYYDLSSEAHNSKYVVYSNYSIGGALKDGVSLMGEGADKTTLFWSGDDVKWGLGCAGNNTVQGLTLTVSDYPTNSRATLVFHSASNITVKDCILKSGDYALYAYNSENKGNPKNIRIFNNLFISNKRYAISVRNCEGLTIDNNTIDLNGSFTVDLIDCKDIRFRNNIVSNNKNEAIQISGAQGIDFRNNNVFNNRFSFDSKTENYSTGESCLKDQTGIGGNISTDPKFSTIAGSNYRLNSNSPCINAGINVGISYQSTAPDMGYYEFGGLGGISIKSNISSNYRLTKPNGTEQMVTSGQTLNNLETGIYGIYPQNLHGYYTPGIKFVYVSANSLVNYFGRYQADNIGPLSRITIYGGAYSTQSPYVTINCDVKDEVNGIDNNSQMKFSNNGVYWSSPESVSNRKLLWDLSKYGGNLNEGAKVVYAMFSDSKGFWSGVVTDTIQYTPNGKIIQISSQKPDIEGALTNANEGDIILVKKGNYTLRKEGKWGDNVLKKGVRLQGADKNDVKVKLVSTLNIEGQSVIENISWRNGYFYLLGGKSQIISNCVFDSVPRFYIQSESNSASIRNSIFKNLTYLGSFIRSNYSFKNPSFEIVNNVFDVGKSSVSSEYGEKGVELGIEGQAILPVKLINNVFLGFKKGDNSGTQAWKLTAPIYVSVDDDNPTDVIISNNNYYNCIAEVLQLYGPKITDQTLPSKIDPLFIDHYNYKLAPNSQLKNHGSTDIYYKNFDGSTNTQGIEGGPFYNTPPRISISATQTNISGQINLVAIASDLQTPSDKLQYRWDFNNDGVFDTGFLTDKSVQHTFYEGSNDSVKCWVFDEQFLMNYCTIENPLVKVNAANKISITTSAKEICSGNNIEAAVITSGFYDSNNQFTIELSDPLGSFSAPIPLYSFTNQSIEAFRIPIPTETLPGSNYRIRLVSSVPKLTSEPTNAITIKSEAISNVRIQTLNETLCNNEDAVFELNQNMLNNPVYNWKVNGNSVGSNSPQFSTKSLKDGDAVWCEINSIETCGSTTLISNPKTIHILNIGTPFIQAVGNLMAASVEEDIQWYLNGNPIEGATSQFYTAKEKGFYQVSVTSSGCVAKSELFLVDDITSTDETLKIGSNIKIYPNPTNGRFRLELMSDHSNIGVVSIYDSLGKKVYSEQFFNNILDLSLGDYPCGVYLISVQTATDIWTQKIIKQ